MLERESALAAEIEARAQESLLEQALESARRGDLERYDELMERIVPSGRQPSRAALQDLDRERQMDRFRVVMAGALVAGLIGIVLLAILSHNGVAAEYVPLVSSLAGIAIGWLYGASGRRRRSDSDG